jgi:DnaJ-class molecular chaperone
MKGTAKKTSRPLTEIEAAILVRMSPDLLRWFTGHAPKHGETRKLPCEIKDGEYFYREADLLDFDRYLREPWPVPEKSPRPGIPAGISRELITEANHKCAFCDHSLHGEGAHIDPVHKSRCNHPHNLIWSCPNHHTEYDRGQKIKTDLSRDQVALVKEMLLMGRLRIWRVELRTIAGYLSAIEALDEFVRTLTRKGGDELLQTLLPQAQALLRATVDSAAKTKAASAVEKNFVRRISALPTAGSREELREAVSAAGDAKEEYLADSGLSACPLCHGSGEHNRFRCPVCQGDGTVPEEIAEEIDLRAFRQVSCPVCKGTAVHNRAECLACLGVGTIDRAREENFDLRPYRQVSCPVCYGFEDRHGAECVICLGVGTIDEGRAENLDLRPFRQAECPLCRGTGTYNRGECPECRSTGKVDAGRAENIDLRRYALVDCPVCHGSGVHRRFDCHPCKGTGKIPEAMIEQIDTSLYEPVECPRCHGKGEFRGRECPFCRGIGTVDVGAAENYDPDG